MKRETGYYWVKYDGQWKIVFYNSDGYNSNFTFHGTSNIFTDLDFEEIHETRIKSPDEK